MFVIAGVDGSDRSRDAIVLAQRIAAVLEAQLVAVHVYPIDKLAGYLAAGSLPEVRRLLNDAPEVAHARVRELASRWESTTRSSSCSDPPNGLVLTGCHPALQPRDSCPVLRWPSRSLRSATPISSPTGRRSVADTTARRPRARLSNGPLTLPDEVVVRSAYSPFSASSRSVM
jgi:hypothetical protein